MAAPSAPGLIATGQRAASAKDAQGWLGPDAGESAFGLIRGHVYCAPYEDVTIKQT